MRHPLALEVYMLQRLLILTLILGFANCAVASAGEDATIPGDTPPTASEAAFVGAMQADLNARFPTARDAERAGYIRYTSADDTGAISYANLHWESADVHHPSQLWYDKNGQLLGADYSKLDSGGGRPTAWGIQPGRWVEFDDHVHYVATDPKTGQPVYDLYVDAKKFAAAGGNVKNPTAQTLVAMQKVDRPGDVVTIFEYPAIWDLIVWVKPNPRGPFAEKNPSVTP
jgi:hypothetical protein